ncbi:hypothetical protein OS493_007628 [Desmophyllum pertusum]|uniref:Uncharacterized protein n=1 Tax=Desmophyllum pertusum TaxID=174260 RepID=A0A9X0CLH4_9CNID|nr:hypothetical protein OS493_007628 [Desmophyllum pertusum]
MATKYELPEEVNEKRLRTLGMEVKMKTFKTNVVLEEETSDNDRLLKIVCVGDYTGGFRTKGVFIDDYLQVRPPIKSAFRLPVVGVDFKLKIKWQRSEAEKPFLIKLQIWEIGEHERFSNMTRIYYKLSLGALVFWGTGRPSSLDGAIKWRQSIRKLPPSIPCVLVTDNVAKEQWIGPGKIFESEVALDEFCKDHGFVDHFEIKSRDWESGEKSVFGQAVNCLLNEILQSEQKRSEDFNLFPVDGYKVRIAEEINEKHLRTLGMEVEMKTFKTNVVLEEETSDNDWLMKIVCVGDYTGGVGTKGVFIDDYLQVRPPVKSNRTPLLGVKIDLKTIKWQRSEAEKPFLIKLQILEIGEQESLFSEMTHVYCRLCLGALVFWGTRYPSSLDGAIKWRQSITRKLLPSIPCVLVTDNVAKESLQWIGPGKIFESEVALDEFCKDHGFVDHFEIKSRDWESGRKAFSEKL